MATSLAALGTCSYNGVTFGVMTASQVDGSPVYDSAGRTVIYVVYKITVETTLNAGGVTSTDSTLEDLRRRLTTPGGELRYNGKGFGNNLSINTGTGGSNPRDVVWGPKPRLLSWESAGGNLSARVKWVVEVAIPDCTSATYLFEKPMSYCFKVQYAIDQEGYTTRTYSGHLLVAQTRSSVTTRTIQYNADQFRDRVVPPLPLGFRRRQTFDLSEDKCRLDFTIVDEELPAPLPPGVLHCDASHQVRNVKPRNLFMWSGTVTANYELDRTVSRALAWKYFLQLVRHRVELTKRFASLNGIGIGAETSAAKSFVLIGNLSMTEPDLYGRNKASFSCNYFFTCDRKVLLRASGLFTPVPDSNYVTWRASLANSAHHIRGNAKMYFSARDDALIDLCDPGTRIDSSSGFISDFRGGPDEPVGNTCPPPNASWLHYALRVIVEVLDQAAELKTLPEEPVDPRPKPPKLEEFAPVQGGILGGAATIINNQDIFQSMYSKGEELSEVQYRTSPTILITLEGEALRACYEIAAPTLRRVGGAEALPFRDESDFYKTAIVGNLGEVPVVGAAWRQTWILTEGPKGVGVPPTIAPVVG